jgi:hypothetical protein
MKLEKDSKHIWYTSYSKSKNTLKSSIIDYTLICVIKPSYSSIKIFDLIHTTLKHLQILEMLSYKILRY